MAIGDQVGYFQIDTLTNDPVDAGFKFTLNQAGSGVGMAVVSSGTNENLTIDAKGSGTITVGGTSTGAITLSRAVTAAAGATISNALSLEAGTAAAAGSAQGDATALGSAAIVHAVTGGDGTKGVKLPTAVAGDVKIVLNSGAAGLKIYPNTDDKINNGSANAAITILKDTMAILVATAADNWAAVFTVNT